MTIKFITFLAAFKVLAFACGGRMRAVMRAVWRSYKCLSDLDAVAAKKFILETSFSWWRSRGFNLRNKFSGEKKRKSDTVFLLGSGPSINELSPACLERIRAEESWGFNFWFVHDFVPDAMFFQSVPKSLHVDEVMKSFVALKGQAYSDSFFFIRGDAVNKGTFSSVGSGAEVERQRFSRIYLAEAFVPSNSKVHPDDLVEILARYGFYDQSLNFPVPKFGSTICMMVSYAIRLGYKKIVLCGIDMNDTGHFYDCADYKARYPELDIISNAVGAGAHPHTASKSRPYAVKDYLRALNKYAGTSAGAEIYVMSQTSTLYPEFKLFEFDQCAGK